MKIRSAPAITAICLCTVLSWSCSSNSRSGAFKTQPPTVSPTPKPKPLVAYLNEGNLWAIQSDGMNQRILAVAREGEAIQDFVWAPDGSRIYFSIGLEFFEVVIQTGNIANAGELNAPPGITIDRLEMGRAG